MGKNWVIQIKRRSVIFVCALSIVTLVVSGCNPLDNGYTEVIDADGDGWTVEDGDCNDDDSDTYPGHQDIRGKWGRNGVDNDCNGVIDG